MTIDQKVAIINDSVNDYFRVNSSSSIVSAMDLLRYSQKMQAVFDEKGKSMRSCLRTLDDAGLIHKVIPSIKYEQSGPSGNRNWYFLNLKGSVIKKQDDRVVPVKSNPSVNTASKSSNGVDIGSIEKLLMDSSSFVRVDKVLQKDCLDNTGLYCIKARMGAAIPSSYNRVLKPHKIIYIGQTKDSLMNRFWLQELNAEGHGTFFRSLGAMLGYLPNPGSLKSGRNYNFSESDEEKIRKWLKDNVVVNCIALKDLDLMDGAEKFLIQKYRPLLNIAHNPDKLSILEDARKKCVEIAIGYCGK